LFVTLLLLFAATLRIVGINYGQPQIQYHPTDVARGTLPLEAPIHPDEYFYVAIPMQMLVNQDSLPHFYENPSFLINLDALTYRLTDAVQGRTPESFANVGQREYAPFHLYVIGRVYSALGGMLAVAATYAAARLLGGRFAALCAGLLVAVSFPMVQHAHYATTSSLAAGFTAVAIWACFASLKTGRGGLFALAGIAAGLAASNRYNAAAVALIVFVGGILLLPRSRYLWMWVLLGLALVPLAFLITTPGIQTDEEKFWIDFNFIFTAYTVGGQVGYGTAYGLFFEYRYLILFGLSVPAALAALVGLGSVIKRRVSFKRFSPFLCILLLVVFLVAYSLVVLRTVRPGHSDQLLLPVIPAFALLAGLGAGWLYDHVPIPRTILAPVLTLALVVIPLTLSLQVVRMFATPDTRLAMQTWIYEHLPPGTRIHRAGPYNVPLDPAIYPATQDFGGQHTPLEQLLAEGVDYVIFSDAYLHDFERSREIVPLELLEQTRTEYGEYTVFPEVARIERPEWTGYDWMMHTATVWHHPGLTIYCLSCTAR
jgi:hypothetical protein